MASVQSARVQGRGFRTGYVVGIDKTQRSAAAVSKLPAQLRNGSLGIDETVALVIERWGRSMPEKKDPTMPLKKAASTLPDVVEGNSCNQTSYKAGKKAFLYVGPGPKGIGYKAMFKLVVSLGEAQGLAQSEPERYEVGTGSWVTTRFSVAEPLPKNIWSRWLKESYAGATGDTKRLGG